MSATVDAALESAAALEQSGRFPEAEASYRKFIGEQPGHAVARFNYACFLRRRGRLEEALREHQAALDRRIDQPEEVISNMAVIHTALRRDDEARVHLEWALSINPEYIPAMYNLGLYHEEFGDRQAALAQFRRILELNPAWHDALIRIAHAETVSDADGEIVRRLRRALRRSNLDPLTREGLHFALGKALDDCGRFESAFEQYELGNRLTQERLAPYDAALVERRVTRLIEAFDSARLAETRPVSDRQVVFVTGMFRSGSTLFEQVLAGHPEVTPGGEIEYLARAPLSLDPTGWEAVAMGYLEYLERTFPGARTVTNKRPDAFALLGMLKALFPNARFVNTVRDPRDTCLSIWFQQFDSRLGYQAELASIAHHYRQYCRLMRHWKSQFGESIFDADYDEFVRDPRTVAEQLLRFLGLEWHEGCLEFQKNRARVRTASVSQVREPLYQRSSGRWRNYEKHLGPLLRALAGA